MDVLEPRVFYQFLKGLMDPQINPSQTLGAAFDRTGPSGCIDPRTRRPDRGWRKSALVLQGDPDRWSAETEILLFTAARRDHMERTILPALAAGKIVICDRFGGFNPYVSRSKPR